MRKNLVILILFIIGMCSFGFAEINEYKQKLQSLEINIEETIKKKSISRYDMAKFLNLSDCVDCKLPSTKTKKNLNNTWRDKFKFTPGKNFEDIMFENTIYNNENYYYCVAYAGQKGYLNGYPKSTSPYCPGKFCGTNNATYSETIQVVFNMLASYKYSQYNANWGKIKDWLNNLDKNSYQYKYFNLTDISNINNGYEKCNYENCELGNADMLSTYAKYCTFNIYECKFIEFDNIKEGNWPIAELNILYENGILELDSINNMDIEKFIDGETLVNLVYKLSTKNSCEFDEDFDKDNIKNIKDNCPYHHNYEQKDTDNDGIGDVCDDDIDNDNIKNPVGIVDEKGNINAKLLQENKDNCIFIANTDQIDNNNNGIGDKCEQDDANKPAIYIQGDPLTGNKPHKSCFKAVYKGNVAQILRDFDDGNYGYGEQICHTFEKAGSYIVVAKLITNSKQTVIGKLTISVFGQGNDYVGFQAMCSPLNGKVPMKTTCNISYKGDIQKVDWIAENEKKTLNTDSNFSKIFMKPGSYEILANGYNSQGKIAGTSKATILLYKNLNGIGANLLADNLKPNVGEKVSFTTSIIGFSEKDINIIEWNFGEGGQIDSKKSSLTKQYEKTGGKIIKQKIILKDGRSLETMLNIFVVEKEEQGEGSNLKADPLYQQVGGNINFSLTTSNIQNNNISKIAWDFGDGTQKSIQSNINEGMNQSHTYLKSGIFRVQAYLILKNGKTLINEATIATYGNNLCQGDLSKFKCDINKNNIPDMCDDDIDGDGINNLLGLITYEKSDCSIDSSNIDNQTLMQEYKIASSGGDLDNCPFSQNSDQSDSNANGIGDKCETNSGKDKTCNYNLTCDSNEGCSCSDCYYESKCTNNKDTDSDGDGINNDQDNCPEIPENINGIQDDDGCPEIEQINPNIGSYVETQNCNQCPCQCSLIKSDIWKGDQIRAGILDINGKIIYDYSETKEITNDILKE